MQRKTSHPFSLAGLFIAGALACTIAKEERDNDEPSGGSGDIVIVRPQTLFDGSSAAVRVDGKEKAVKVGQETLSIGVAAGTYEVYDATATKPVATLKAVSGESLYIVDKSDAEALRKLADLLYHMGNREAALSLYRSSLLVDSTQTSFYKRYAELEAELGNKKEALRALTKVVSAGGGDAATYRAMGAVYLAAREYKEAAHAFEKAVAKGGEDGEALAGLGTARMRAGDLPGALTACERAVRAQPDSASHYRALGNVLMATGDTVRAIANCRQFIDKGGVSQNVAATLGAYDHAQRRFEDAVRYLSMVKGKAAARLDYLYMLGESHYRLGNHAKAFPPLRQAANTYTRAKEWPEIVELLIESYIGLKEYKKATFWVNKYAKEGKRQSPDVAYYRAYLIERSSPTRARSLYEKNLETWSDDHRNYLRLGVMESRAKATAGHSVTMLKKALSLADTIPQAWLEIARAYRALGDTDEELKALRVFVASEPQHPEANARIGELMLRKGDTDEAIRRLETASAEAADDPNVLSALAQGYARTGRIDEAIAELEKAKKKAPRDGSVRRKLADLYERSGQNDKLMTELRELIEIDRDNETLLKYAGLLHSQHKFREAADAIENIRATDPTNVDALMLLGSVYRAAGKYDQAIEIYKEIVSIDPAYHLALYERAETHRANSELNWAQKFYERTLKAEPSFALAALGLARVAKARGDDSGYRAYLGKARRLDPRNPEIMAEAGGL